MAELVHVFDNEKIDLSTLAAGVAILGASKIDASRAQAFRVVMSEIVVSYDGLTAAEGPISIWLSMNMSVTEVANWLAADPATKFDPPVKGKGMYMKLLASSDRSVSGVFNNGTPIIVKPNWTVGEGQGLNIAVVNDDAGALTTGVAVFVRSHHMGVWVGQ